MRWMGNHPYRQETGWIQALNVSVSCILDCLMSGINRVVIGHNLDQMALSSSPMMRRNNFLQYFGKIVHLLVSGIS